MTRFVWFALLSLLGACTAWANGLPRASMAFVGDVMLADGPGRAMRRGVDPFADFAQILQKTDIRIANLECVVAAGGSPVAGKPWTFQASPRVLPVLKRHFDVMALANNHTLDYGPQAFVEMLGHLERGGLSYVGGGRNAAQAHSPLIIERNGLKIALLSYNEFFPRNFQAEAKRPGVAWSEDAFVVHDIARARAQHGADLVIPFMHWGQEYTSLANERQRRLARLMIDAGADAVVGGHPHVTQDTETYAGKPIIYSLGNFVFDGFSEDAAKTGWLLTMELDKQGVSAWRTRVAHMNKSGIPHLDRKALGDCWKRGDALASTCPASGL
jgi:poly-gamma-glutamate capsule biosynthesis protein CapA/YwtB (metallophosphatase superfamily)